MLSRATVIALLYAMVLAGYPLVAAAQSLIGLEDARWPSIAVRILTSLLALLCLFKSRTSLRAYSPLFLGAFLVFWAMYWVRILSDAFWAPVPMPMPPIELFATTLLFAFVPALGGFVGLSSDFSHRAARFVMIVGGLALVFLLLNGDTFARLALKGDMARFSIEKLNPILVSLVGATVMLVAIAQAFTPSRPVNPVMRVAMLALAGLGLLVLLLGASKGPTLAVGAALFAFALFPITPVRVVGGGVIAALLVVVALNMQSTLSSSYGIDVGKRFENADTSSSVESREASYASAWRIFGEHPVLGGPVMEPVTGYYPHNTTLEAFMATGVLGGTAYLICMVLALVASVRALQARRGHEWMALLTILFIVSSQFSGSHYAAGPHWLMMAAIVFSQRRADARIAAGVSARHVGQQFA